MAKEYVAALEDKYNVQAKRIIELKDSLDGQTVLVNATYYATSAVSTGSRKELTKIRSMMKQLVYSVTSQAATVATLSTKINGSSSGGAGWNTDKKKARPSLHVCAYCKQELYHKDTNCLEMGSNKTKRYPGCKIIFTKEYDELGCFVSGVGVQNWITKLKLKIDVPLLKYYTPLTSQVEELAPTDTLCNLQVGKTQNPGFIRDNCRVRFTLLPQHTDKDSASWRRHPPRKKRARPK